MASCSRLNKLRGYSRDTVTQQRPRDLEKMSTPAVVPVLVQVQDTLHLDCFSVVLSRIVLLNMTHKHEPIANFPLLSWLSSLLLHSSRGLLRGSFIDELHQALAEVVEVKNLDVEDLDCSLDLVVHAVPVLQSVVQILLKVLDTPLQIRIAHFHVLLWNRKRMEKQRIGGYIYKYT